MNSMRKAFEAWAIASPRGWGVRRYMSSEMPWPGEYQEYRVQCAWEAWQDACAAEREACAAICERERDEAQIVTGAFRAQECAKRIRARSQK